MSVGFIGAGRMAQAMARGFIASGLVNRANVLASDPDQRMLNAFKELGVKVTKDNKHVVSKSDVVVLAIKPDLMENVLKDISPVVSASNLFVSVAAGVTISDIEKNLPPNSRVIRVMPNTPALVNAGAAVMATGENVDEEDADLVQDYFKSIGICEETSEKMLDAVTGVSGSGPAYAFMAIEALADGGVKMGLPRDLALKLAAQTLFGAAKMVLETKKHPGELKDMVCSAGGTTICAMHSLERGGFRGTIIDAVETATNKAREMSDALQAKEEKN